MNISFTLLFSVEELKGQWHRREGAEPTLNHFVGAVECVGRQAPHATCLAREQLHVILSFLVSDHSPVVSRRACLFATARSTATLHIPLVMDTITSVQACLANWDAGGDAKWCAAHVLCSDDALTFPQPRPPRLRTHRPGGHEDSRHPPHRI